MTLNLGAHQSIAGGYTNPLNSIFEKGGTSLQIFSASPRGWSFPRPTEEQVNEFVELKEKLKINPIYFHASYLLNLAKNDRVGQLSVNSLTHELKLAAQMKIKGTIVHLGSFKSEMPLYENHDNYGDITVNIKKILEKTPPETVFIIENAGNNKIGKTLDEISLIVEQVDSPRVKICLDTCHLYSAGYDLSTKEKLEQFLETFDSLIGLERLELFHFNDSRDPYKSGRDRHENIGKGTIPTSTFKLIMNHPKLSQLPFIIETPGFDGKGPDKQNLDILKSIYNEK